MDAGKGHYNHFLPHCLRLLAEDGIIVADNVLFRGMVASDELVRKEKDYNSKENERIFRFSIKR